MINKEFKKRYLHTPKEFFHQIKMTMQLRKKIKNIRKENKLSKSFAKKIMLAVTGVNKCVYCTYKHATEALKRNINKDEIEKILKGEFENISKDESTALLYAQHWTENNGDPEPDARNEMINFYGKEKTDYIEFYMHIVNMANLISNTVEAYKKGIKPDKGKLNLFFTYLLCAPIAASTKRSGSKGEAYFKDSISYLK